MINMDHNQQTILFTVCEVHAILSTKCKCETYLLRMSWLNWIDICWLEQTNTYMSSGVEL